MDKARKLLLWITAMVGVGSVALQLWLNLTRYNPDHSLAWRFVDFASYFTNTTAILATAVVIASLAGPASRLAGPPTMAATAVYLLIVAVTYQWLLRGDPHGMALIANVGVHELLPALVILLWIGFTPKQGLTFSRPLRWLIYPALYMAWTLARGAVIHRYPYFFANADKLGYPRTLLNGVGFLTAFYLLGLGAVGLGRLMPARTLNVPVPFRSGTG
jgi:hypothetical protein